MNMYPRPMYQQMQGGRGPRNGPQRVKYSTNARNMSGNAQQAPRAPQAAAQPRPAAPAPLTAAALAEAPADRQKNMIGERLYPLIHQLQPMLAGKITGMLLEFENAELLNLLESPKDLKKRVNEAIEVLNAHSKQTTKQ